MSEFYYDYIQRNMIIKKFILYRKTEIFLQNIKVLWKKRFNSSCYKIYQTILVGTNKKLLSLMKAELGDLIMREFMGIRIHK